MGTHQDLLAKSFPRGSLDQSWQGVALDAAAQALNYSRKNQLYQAFRALVCAICTVFLLQYLANAHLREAITETTNKAEQFHAFCKWLFFGGEGRITDQTPEEQEKRIKYSTLLANAVVLHNTLKLSCVLAKLAKEGYHSS